MRSVMRAIGDLNLAEWAEVATIAGAVVAILVLGYTGYQVRANTRISRGQFWLELRKMFAEHDDVHRKLRPGGAWHKSAEHPNLDEMAEVEAYMGLFEHCETMLDENLIDTDTFRHIYAYRLHNIVNNHQIRKNKLHTHRKDWERFIALLKRLDMLALLYQQVESSHPQKDEGKVHTDQPPSPSAESDPQQKPRT